jgi:hypothetical protein
LTFKLKETKSISFYKKKNGDLVVWDNPFHGGGWEFELGEIDYLFSLSLPRPRPKRVS